MTPTLVTAPTATPVDLDALKDHLRIRNAHEDALITALAAAAVGYLDGWRGILGRAIMPQTWAVTVTQECDVTLPMPDVTAVSVDYGDGAVVLSPVISDGGPVVAVTGAGVITFDCAMPTGHLDIAKVVVTMLVAHLFENRGAGLASGLSGTLPDMVGDLIGILRHRRF